MTTYFVNEVETPPGQDVSQDSLYRGAAEEFGPSLERLARAYEANGDDRRDLLQEIHFHIWRSLANFDRRCSLRTWVYRIAHNVATAHVMRQKRQRNALVSVEQMADFSDAGHGAASINRESVLERLSVLIQKLKPLDRQIIVSYLEGFDAKTIAEVTGLSAAHVAMKIHRIKSILRDSFGEGGAHAD